MINCDVQMLVRFLH